MSAAESVFDLAGWSIGRAAEVDWVDWGSGGLARAKLLASGDGMHLALVEAQPGYRGDPHVHERTEMLHVLDGSVVTNGEVLVAGDAYVAAAGSVHEAFATETGATYISVFAL